MAFDKIQKAFWIPILYPQL